MSHPRDILESIEARARKSLSQNFLTSPHWAETLTRAVTSSPEPDEYWEIGPGLGALTDSLLKKTEKPVRLFEYDRKLVGYLEKRFPEVTIHAGDFLKQTLPETGTVAVISNMPYHLSSPILYKLADVPGITQLVLTFQKEFAERLSASPRVKEYGALSVVSQLQYEISSLGTIPPGAFFPVPDVSSEALLLTPRHQAFPDTLPPLVKAAFAHRRKTLLNNLKHLFPRESLERAFTKNHLLLDVRAEELSTNQFVSLHQSLPC